MPESIPEDEELMFQCEKCNGNIRFYLHTKKWECDTCDWNEDDGRCKNNNG